jgi:hypothetical protein
MTGKSVDDETLVILLTGSIKQRQQRDIDRAIAFFATVRCELRKRPGGSRGRKGRGGRVRSRDLSLSGQEFVETGGDELSALAEKRFVVRHR